MNIRMLSRILCALCVLFGFWRISHVKDVAGGSNAQTYNHQAKWFVEIIDNNADVGTYNSIAFDPLTGLPQISYFDHTNQTLKLALYRGSGLLSCLPQSKWNCVSWDGSGFGNYSSIDIFYDEATETWKRGISYYDHVNGRLRYAEDVVSPGGSSGSYSTIDDSVNVNDFIGLHTSMKFDSNGVPHIAYYSYTFSGNSSLKYAHKVPVNQGNCGPYNNWQCNTILQSGTSNPGLYASLDIGMTGRPNIAYYIGGDHDLGYAWLSYPAGSPSANCGPEVNYLPTWTCKIIDSASGVDLGKFASLHARKNVSSDSFKIAYYDATHGYLKYAQQVGSGGNCGEGLWQCDLIEYIGTNLVQKSIALAVDKSYQPIIAYKDANNGLFPASLNIAYPLTTTGNCGPGWLGTWQCTIIDSGGEHLDVADFVSIDVSAGGLVAIAYNEYDENNFEQKLKIVYQQFNSYLPLVRK